MVIDLEIKYQKPGVSVTATRTIKAIKVAPGLAVHQCPDNDDLWNITHVGSGYAVLKRLPSRTAAKDIAAKFANVLDWSELDYEGSVARPARKSQYRRIMRLIEMFGE
jgi:hypothetical protein